MRCLLFSMVIPAYNAELYLRKCVDSCMNQKGDVPNYEIIIVNDGSTDGTQGIIDNYINANLNVNENDNNPKVSFIRQPNGGLSKARNEGLKKAKGEYVWFVDADDWIAENALAVLTQIINENNHPDVIIFRGSDWRDGITKERRSVFSSDLKDLSGMDVLREMGTAYWNPCVPFYCMKRRMLIENALQFMEGVIHEDSEFTPRMLYTAQSAYASSEKLYYVFQNPVSLNRKKNPEKAFHTLRVIDSLCSFSNDILQQNDRLIFNDIIATTMNMAMKETKNMNREIKMKFCKKISNHMLFHMFHTSHIKFRIESLLLYVFPYFMVTIVSKKTN